MFVAAALLASLLAPPQGPASSDEVFKRDGTRFTGTLESWSESEVVFVTSDGERIRLPPEKIARLTLGESGVETMARLLAPIPKPTQPAPALRETAPQPLAGLASAPPSRSVSPLFSSAVTQESGSIDEPSAAWDVTVNGGYTGKRGTDDADTVRGDFQAIRRTEPQRYLLVLNSSYYYQIQDENVAGDKIFGSARVDRFLSAGNSWRFIQAI